MILTPPIEENDLEVGLHVRLRQMLGAAALMLTSTTVPAVVAHAQTDETGVPGAQGQPSASDGVASDLETSVARTLEANPGSARTGESTVSLQPGIMAALPDGEVGIQAAGNCPHGWLCAWPHSDFRGPMLGVRQGTYIPYWEWAWNSRTGEVRQCVMSVHCPGSDWHSYFESITSIFNNTYSITWAPFYSPRNGQNYYAYIGAPSGYVGSRWNDSFSAACAC